MKLQDRKNTTKKGLKELQKLIDGFDFCNDINVVESDTFFARVERDNGMMWGDIHYVDWTNINAKWKIIAGEIKLMTMNETSCGEYNAEATRIDNVDQLNFSDCVKALQVVIEKYNNECEKKDIQISEFLAFCENYNKTK